MMSERTIFDDVDAFNQLLQLLPRTALRSVLAVSSDWRDGALQALRSKQYSTFRVCRSPSQQLALTGCVLLNPLDAAIAPGETLHLRCGGRVMACATDDNVPVGHVNGLSRRVTGLQLDESISVARVHGTPTVPTCTFEYTTLHSRRLLATPDVILSRRKMLHKIHKVFDGQVLSPGFELAVRMRGWGLIRQEFHKTTITLVLRVVSTQEGEMDGTTAIDLQPGPNVLTGTQLTQVAPQGQLSARILLTPFDDPINTGEGTENLEVFRTAPRCDDGSDSSSSESV
jgi:hypothetical protein